MARNTRTHPTPQELSSMGTKELLKYARREAKALLDQKQTAVPRLLLELAARLKFNAQGA